MGPRGFALLLAVALGCGCDGGSDAPTTALQRITKLANRNGDINKPSTRRPLVTLEEFFEGNYDSTSIGYNYHPDQPAPAEFHALFIRIRARADVTDIRLEIDEHNPPDSWPSAGVVWIITSATSSDVSKWLGKRFREVWERWGDHRNVERYDVPKGLKAIGFWWD